MATNNRIRDKTMQHYTNTEATKTSVLSSATIEKYEYLTGR